MEAEKYYKWVKASAEDSINKEDILINDLVIHEDGDVGIVMETKYNNTAEVNVFWVTTDKRAGRTSIIYLAKVLRWLNN